MNGVECCHLGHAELLEVVRPEALLRHEWAADRRETKLESGSRVEGRCSVHEKSTL